MEFIYDIEVDVITGLFKARFFPKKIGCAKFEGICFRNPLQVGNRPYIDVLLDGNLKSYNLGKIVDIADIGRPVDDTGRTYSVVFTEYPTTKSHRSNYWLEQDLASFKDLGKRLKEGSAKAL